MMPCYAGISNIHIDPYGNVWPCCILAYTKSFGNLRDIDYNFEKLWNSKIAKDVRKFIKNKNCYCPMANQAYSNMLINFRTMLKVLKNLL